MTTHWTHCDRPAPPTLKGRYCRLEKLDWTAHGDGLFEAICGPGNNNLWTYIPIGPFPDRSVFEQIFEFVRSKFDWETLVIRNADTSQILGMASYMRMRPEHGSAEVGCVIFGHNLKRTRQATEAMYLMAQHLFDELGYRRYEWKCDNSNEASRRAAERLGFVFEGVFRKDIMIKGNNRDTAWFSMTDDDWSSRRTALERWLDPINFGEKGRQHTPLQSLM